MNETFDDKTLMQYAMSSSPYLGIYCKTKQIACISCLTSSTDTALSGSHDRIRDEPHSWVFPIDSSA